jgi:hypothetical protein
VTAVTGPETYQTFVRLEYLTRDGWVKGHAGLTLQDPARYVERLLDKDKFGRAVELSDVDLSPTGVVWAPSETPDPSTLLPSQTAIPALPGHFTTCDLCGRTDHKTKDECLL